MTTMSEPVDQAEIPVGDAMSLDQVDGVYGDINEASVAEDILTPENGLPVLNGARGISHIEADSESKSLIDSLYDSSLQREAILNHTFADVYYREGYEPSEVRALLALVANGIDTLTLARDFDDDSMLPDLNNLAVTPSVIREKFAAMDTVLFRPAYAVEDVKTYIEEIAEDLEARISAISLRIAEIEAIHEQKRIEQIAAYQEEMRRAARAAAAEAERRAEVERINAEIELVWDEAVTANDAWDEAVRTRAEEDAAYLVEIESVWDDAVAENEARNEAARVLAEEALAAEALDKEGATVVDENLSTGEIVWEGEGGSPLASESESDIAEDADVDAANATDEDALTDSPVVAETGGEPTPELTMVSVTEFADRIKQIASGGYKMHRVFIGGDSNGFIPVSGVETDASSEVLVVQSLESEPISLLEFSAALSYVQAEATQVNDYVVVFRSEVGLHPIDRCDIFEGNILIYVQ